MDNFTHVKLYQFSHKKTRGQWLLGTFFMTFCSVGCLQNMTGVIDVEWHTSHSLLECPLYKCLALECVYCYTYTGSTTSKLGYHGNGPI